MSDDEEVDVTWWKTLLWGLGVLAFGAFLFWYLSHLEDTGGAGRVPWYVAILYYVGGKWTVAAGAGLISLVFFYLTFKQLRGSRED